MNKLNNKSGFTLIEIIVVMIIVGILAAIALPNLFGNIQKSKGTQALTTMDSYKTSLETCATANSGTTVGVAPCTLAGQNDPATVGIWTFSIPAAAVAQSVALANVVAPFGNYLAGSLVYSINASDGTNSISLTRDAGGSWTCSTGSASPYTGIC